MLYTTAFPAEARFFVIPLARQKSIHLKGISVITAPCELQQRHKATCLPAAPVRLETPRFTSSTSSEDGWNDSDTNSGASEAAASRAAAVAAEEEVGSEGGEAAATRAS